MKKSIAVFLVILFLVLVLFSVRLFSSREIDDVSPQIPCEDKYLMKSDILWVVPNYNNISISSDKEWCRRISGLNKEIGLHGVIHEFEEFGVDRNSEYLSVGVKSFIECFGFIPDSFKPPQLAISEENENLIKTSEMELKGRLNQITHKVYHCDDTGIFPNWVIDLF